MDITQSYQKLIEEYKSSSEKLSDKERAILENNIWDAYRHSRTWNDQVPERRAWLSEQLGEKPGHIEMRFTLLQAGRWVSPLWDMLSHTSYNAVLRMFREAKSLAQYSMSGEEAVIEVINKHKETGDVKERNIKKVRESRPPDESVELVAKSKEFSRRIDAAVSEFLDAALSDSEAYVRRQMEDDFRSIIVTACDDLRRQIHKIRRNTKRDKNHAASVSRNNFNAACEVLGYSATFGKPIDREIYRRLWARRASELHPDKGAGPGRTAEYDAVNQAYATLEDYRENFTQQPKQEPSR